MIVTSQDRVVVAGLTGGQGSFWSERMMEYGTNVVGGISASKAGTTHLGVPVLGSFAEAAGEVGVDVGVLFVPPVAARPLAIDAIDSGVRTLVILTEFIPVHDTIAIVHAARETGCAIVGPNTAGIVTPGEAFAGFMPAFNDRIFKVGDVGVVSRSGSLGTLACMELTRAGRGQSAFIGIGGDPVSGTSTRDALAALDAHAATKAVVLIGPSTPRRCPSRSRRSSPAGPLPKDARWATQERSSSATRARGTPNTTRSARPVCGLSMCPPRSRRHSPPDRIRAPAETGPVRQVTR